SSSMTASNAIPVRQASALPSASFRFHLTMNTLAVQLAVPLAGPAEDFHLQVSAPCRAHKKRARHWRTGFISYLPGGLFSPALLFFWALLRAGEAVRFEVFDGFLGVKPLVGVDGFLERDVSFAVNRAGYERDFEHVRPPLC